MIQHFPNVRPGSTLYIPWGTYAGATGASITMTGLAVTDIEVYKNGAVAQRASDTGFALLDTDGTDFDGITGIHGISIDLSSNATAGFFTAGGFYWVVVSAVTVDAQTVNFVLATFTIGYASAIINTTIATLATQTSFTLTVGPAEASALVGCTCIIHNIASAVQFGFGRITAYAVTTRTVTLAAGVTFTAAAGDNISIFPPMTLGTVPANFADLAITASTGHVTLADASLTAPKFATDAITAIKIAADAVAKIQAGLSTFNAAANTVLLDATPQAQLNTIESELLQRVMGFATFGTINDPTPSATEFVVSTDFTNANDHYVSADSPLRVYALSGDQKGKRALITDQVGLTITVGAGFSAAPVNGTLIAIMP